jgi:hypothetical protein
MVIDIPIPFDNNDEMVQARVIMTAIFNEPFGKRSGATVRHSHSDNARLSWEFGTNAYSERKRLRVWCHKTTANAHQRALVDTMRDVFGNYDESIAKPWMMDDRYGIDVLYSGGMAEYAVKWVASFREPEQRTG